MVDTPTTIPTPTPTPTPPPATTASPSVPTRGTPTPNPAVALPIMATKQVPPVFSTSNAISDGKNKLKRIEFEFGGTSYKFALNPEEYLQSEPNRINVTQTKAGGWVDAFGGGVQTISFKGSTGFKNGTSDGGNGFAKFKELRDFIRNIYFGISPGTEITTDRELIFHNYTDGEHWIVVPKQFDLHKSVARPLLYMYEIQLVCVRSADTPAFKDTNLNPTISSPNIGGSDTPSGPNVGGDLSGGYSEDLFGDSGNDLFGEPQGEDSEYTSVPNSSEISIGNSNFVDSIVQVNNPRYVNVAAKTLSSMLGDVKGLIPNGLVTQVLNSYQATNPGIVQGAYSPSDGTGFAYNIVNNINPSLQQLSAPGYSMYQSFLAKDPSIVDTVSSSLGYSPLLASSKDLVPTTQAKVGVVYTEVTALYHQLLNLTGQGFRDSNRTDLQGLSDKVRVLSAVLESLPYPPYDALEGLRKLQQTVGFLHSQPTLFNSTYQAKLDDYAKVLGGVF